MDVDSGSLVSGPLRRVGRYALFDCVGHGATATVHIGRLLGPAGFSKTVAIKRMHENVGRDPEVAAMFLDEARLSGRIRHPNVVATTDLLAMDGETFLIMEYVHGDSLSSLSDALRARGEHMPHAIAVHVMRDVLNGLHAAHEAQDEVGRPLHLVHRDVSPHNIQLGVDGSARVLDFGIAKALGRLQDTHLGQVKGKLAYMAPEQLLGQPFDRRVDVFAAGVVLWETLAGRRLFFSDNPGQTVQRILGEDVPDLASLVPFISPTLARAVAKATARLPEQRFATALEFAHELEHAAEIVTPRLVGEWIRRTAGEKLEQRARRLRQIECTPIVDAGPSTPSTLVEHEPERPFERTGPDEPTRSDVHVRAELPDLGDPFENARPLRPSTETLTPTIPTRPIPTGLGALVLRERRSWLGVAAAAVAALGLTFGIVSTRTGSDPKAPVVVTGVAPEPEKRAAGSATVEREVMTALPSAETPRATTQPPKRRDKAVQRSARPAARAPTKTKVQAKAARAKAAPSPARRAEDLFSRN